MIKSKRKSRALSLIFLAGAVRVFSSVFIERGEFKLPRVVSLMSRNSEAPQSSRSTTFNDTKAQITYRTVASAAKADFLLLRRYKYDLITGTVLLQSKTTLHTKRNESELKGTVQFSERSLL